MGGTTGRLHPAELPGPLPRAESFAALNDALAEQCPGARRRGCGATRRPSASVSSGIVKFSCHCRLLPMMPAISALDGRVRCRWCVTAATTIPCPWPTAIRHRTMLAGVGLELGAINAHQAHAQQLQLLGQKQNLQEALRHRREVLPPEARDRIVVGVTVRRNEANPDIAVRRPLDPTAGKDPVGVAVDQQRQHHPGVILRRARAAMVHLEGAQSDTLHRLDHEVRQIIRRDPVPQIGRKQKRLVPITVHEVAHPAILREIQPKVRQTASCPKTPGGRRQPPTCRPTSRSASGFSPSRRKPPVLGSTSSRHWIVFASNQVPSLTFLRRQAGRSSQRRVSSVMAAWRFCCLGRETLRQRFFLNHNDIRHVRQHNIRPGMNKAN